MSQNLLSVLKHHDGKQKKPAAKKKTWRDYRDAPVLEQDKAKRKIEIKQSFIKDAGLGLFATTGFRKGDIITEYDGEVISDTDAKKKRALRDGSDSHIASLTPFHTAIDGRGITATSWGRGGGAFVNDTKNNKFNNAKFATYTPPDSAPFGKDKRTGLPSLDHVYLIATRDIEASEEIYAPYENDYWSVAHDTATQQQQQQQQNQDKKKNPKKKKVLVNSSSEDEDEILERGKDKNTESHGLVSKHRKTECHNGFSFYGMSDALEESAQEHQLGSSDED